MPEIKTEWVNDELTAKWEKILAVRNDITKALETARQEKLINHSLTAMVDVYAEKEQYAFIKEITNLEEIVIVSKLVVHEANDQIPESASESEFFPGLKIVVSNAPGKKCERCWMYFEEEATDNEHPDLCPRCANVVKNIEL
jgi:isoleucyl-tRNA synthetase